MEYSVKWLESVDSTNSEAIRCFSDSDEFSVFAAKFQTGGRGQRGAGWESESGKNLTFSLIIKPSNLKANHQFAINKVITLSLKRYLEITGIEAKVKWPNDIYVGEGKICGILIENFLSGDKLSGSVIGIGLNVNQKKFFSDAPNPVSMSNLTGKEYLIEDELDNLLKIVLQMLKESIGDNGEIAPSLHKEYLKSLYRGGLFYEYEDVATGELFVAKITGVGKNGALILEKENGKRKSYLFKEVRFRFSNVSCAVK